MAIPVEVQQELEALRLANRELSDYKTHVDREMQALRANRENTGAVPAPRKDLGLQSMIKLWSGESTGPSVEEFLKLIDMVASTGNWQDQDKKFICRLKTIGPAAACLDAHPELMKPESTYAEFQTVLRRRFGECMDPERHLLALNSVSQGPGEGAAAFADRCKALGLKATRKTENVQEAAWARTQMDRTVLTAFIKGLKGSAGIQLQYYPPANLEEAILRAERIELAQGGGRTSREIFGTSREEERPPEVAIVQQSRVMQRKEIVCYACGGTGHMARNCANRSSSQPRRNQKEGRGLGVQKPSNLADSRENFCFVCADPEHFASRCPKRAQRPQSFRDHVRGNPSLSKRPSSSPNLIGSVEDPPSSQ